MDVELPIFKDSFDVAIPFYPDASVVSESRPLDMEGITLEVSFRFQACNDEQCLLPRTEKLSLEVPLEVSSCR